jgi:hypothetical protein
LLIPNTAELLVALQPWVDWSAVRVAERPPTAPRGWPAERAARGFWDTRATSLRARNRHYGTPRRECTCGRRLPQKVGVADLCGGADDGGMTTTAENKTVVDEFIQALFTKGDLLAVDR